MKKSILYIGGFEMPDGNAAAQRVMAVAKSLQNEYNIFFIGKTRNGNISGQVEGMEYINLPYPTNKKEWFSHLSGDEELKYLKKLSPDIVICYNFPALGLYRVLKYCRKHEIKIVGDITEWYHPHNFIKWLDTTWRMIKLNKQMDGLVVISHYLRNYYNGNKTYHMPPTVDSLDKKWNLDTVRNNDKQTITLMYAGSPGRGDKDRLENLIGCLFNYPKLLLEIVGVTADDFVSKFPQIAIPENVRFNGRLSHEKTISMLCKSDFSIFFRQPSRVNNAGFPTKFAEAQSAGIPVVTSRFSDLELYVEEGKNGYLANSIGRDDIDTVLAKVSKLSQKDIQTMHDYTKSLNLFDYRNYQEQLVEFFHTL